MYAVGDNAIKKYLSACEGGESESSLTSHKDLEKVKARFELRKNLAKKVVLVVEGKIRGVRRYYAIHQRVFFYAGKKKSVTNN